MKKEHARTTEAVISIFDKAMASIREANLGLGREACFALLKLEIGDDICFSGNCLELQIQDLTIAG